MTRRKGRLVSAVLAVSEVDWGDVEAFAEAAAAAGAGAAGAEAAPMEEVSDAAHSGSGGGGGGGGGRMVVPGFGVHPWFVQDAAPGWEERLAGLLERHPGAIVGEVGLCKAAKNLRKPKDEEQPGQTGGEVAPAAAAAKAEAGGTVEVEADGGSGGGGGSSAWSKAGAWARQESFLGRQLALAAR